MEQYCQRFYNELQKNGRVQRKGCPELKDKSLSPRVVRGVHTLLSNCLEQAVAERLILTNPAAGCKLPKLEKKEMKVLPQKKIGMYLAEAERRGPPAAFYGFELLCQSRQILGIMTHIEGQLYDFAKRTKDGHGALFAGNITFV